jgi:hypothetical protein
LAKPPSFDELFRGIRASAVRLTYTMYIFIPQIGTKLILLQPWSFQLVDEYRNYDMWVKLTNGQGPPRSPSRSSPLIIKYSSSGQALPVTLSPGTILVVDRIYIRKGQQGFNSVAFRILKGSPVPFGRFWAKLDEVNQGLDAKVAP